LQGLTDVDLDEGNYQASSGGRRRAVLKLLAKRNSCECK
jgi:hypothetical protein